MFNKSIQVMRILVQYVLLVFTVIQISGCGGSESFKDPPPSPEPQILTNLKMADPLRGSTIFATPPNTKLLICADCHSDDPLVNNFGNIWSGRNAVELIERAINSNTGGMGYLRNLLTYDEMVDIAAYLGNSPNSLNFENTKTAFISVEKNITISSGLKTPVENLKLLTVGPFKIGQTTCTHNIPRFDSCVVGVIFLPKTKGDFNGALIISHDGSPVPIEIKLKGSGI
jgi:hypothetical protein